MSNMYLIRAEETRQLPDTFNGLEWVPGLVVPDIKIPPESWDAVACDGGFLLRLEWQSKVVHSVWQGPHTIAGQTIYFVSIDDDSDQSILQELRDRLGGTSNVAPLIRVLQLQNAKGAAVRAYCKASGLFSPIRNAAGRIVGLHAPLVIAGRSGADMDGDDVEAAEILTELE